MYSVEIEHKGLHKYRVIKGNDRYVVEQKAYVQLKEWDEMWEKKQEVERKKRERENVEMEKVKRKQWQLTPKEPSFPTEPEERNF